VPDYDCECGCAVFETADKKRSIHAQKKDYER
jgi:hypothetical protein